MQPFWNSTIFSCACSNDAFLINAASMLSSAMSLTITAKRKPSRFLRMCLSSVVLPEPKKPDSSVTGSRSGTEGEVVSGMAGRSARGWRQM